MRRQARRRGPPSVSRRHCRHGEAPLSNAVEMISPGAGARSTETSSPGEERGTRAYSRPGRRTRVWASRAPAGKRDVSARPGLESSTKDRISSPRDDPGSAGPVDPQVGVGSEDVLLVWCIFRAPWCGSWRPLVAAPGHTRPSRPAAPTLRTGERGIAPSISVLSRSLRSPTRRGVQPPVERGHHRQHDLAPVLLNPASSSARFDRGVRSALVRRTVAASSCAQSRSRVPMKRPNDSSRCGLVVVPQIGATSRSAPDAPQYQRHAGPLDLRTHRVSSVAPGARRTVRAVASGGNREDIRTHRIANETPARTSGARSPCVVVPPATAPRIEAPSECRDTSGTR